MSNDDTTKKTSYNLEQLSEGWAKLLKSYVLLRNRQTGEKKMFTMREGIVYLVDSKNRTLYEVERTFTTDEEIAVAETLYGKSNK